MNNCAVSTCYVPTASVHYSYSIIYWKFFRYLFFKKGTKYPVYPRKIKSSVAAAVEQGAGTTVREHFQQNRMRNTAINDNSLMHTLINGIGHALDFGNHAAGDDAMCLVALYLGNLLLSYLPLLSISYYLIFLFPVHFFVIALIISASYFFHPRLVIQVPFDSLHNADFEFRFGIPT